MSRSALWAERAPKRYLRALRKPSATAAGRGGNARRLTDPFIFALNTRFRLAWTRSCDDEMFRESRQAPRVSIGRHDDLRTKRPRVINSRCARLASRGDGSFPVAVSVEPT